VPTTYDVIVVGAGAMGSAATYHLAKRGLRVLALEQFDIPHAMGSSHGLSRMIRLAYYEHPDYVPLLRQAYLLWDQLEAETNQKILYVTGGLYMGRSDSELITGSLRAVKEYNIPHERLTRDDLRRRFPQFTVPEDFTAIFDHYAGFVLSEKAIAIHCERALRRGAEIHGQEQVLDWKAASTGVTIRTNRNTYEAGHVIFTSGAWTSKIVGELGVRLRVTRQVLGWLWPKNPDSLSLGNLPVWMIEYPDGKNHYGFPMMPDYPGFKLAQHVPGETADADTLSRNIQPGDEDTILPIRNAIPNADGPLLSLRVCMYTNSPDSHFIIDHHPNHKNVTIACGFSGHGFKFSSAIGQILADLSTHGSSPLPVKFLGLSRFHKDPQ
jgi:sarcosine oxidase